MAIKIKNYFKDKNNTITFVFLLVLFIAGFYLRVINLGYLSFWGDDGHTVVGTLSTLKHGYPLLPGGNILWHGIFDYYLKAPAAALFKGTEFAFRITSVIFGSASIIAVYFTGKKIANKFVGFLSAFLIAFSTWYIQFSREARYYQDLQFFFVLSFLFFYLGFIEDRKVFKILATALFILTPLLHGIGVTLIILFVPLLLLKGRSFFKKDIIISFLTIIAANALIILNQVLFWKVGRSFYTEETGFKALVAAYFKTPDPFYYKIIEIMFGRMFYVFLAGIAVFVVFAVIISIKKKDSPEVFLTNERFVKWGSLRWPFNLFLVYYTFNIVILFMSAGRMYGQQRYVYFLMPIFIICFSYTVFLACLAVKKLLIFLISKNRKTNKVLFDYILAVLFIILSFVLIKGVNPYEAHAIAYKKHNEKIDVMYSISNSWNVHWDAAQGGKYVYEHSKPDDIIITTDIYNSPPYTKRVDYWLWTGSLVSWAPYHSEEGKVIDDTYGVELIRDFNFLANILIENSDKDIWILTSKSLFISEHIDPGILKILEGLNDNLVLTGRDDVSRLYHFPKTSGQDARTLEYILKPPTEGTLKVKKDTGINLNLADPGASQYLIYGFSDVEEGNGTWADGGSSILFAEFEDIESDYYLKINARPLNNKKESQTLELIFNGIKVDKFKFMPSDNFTYVHFILPAELIKDNANSIELKYGYSVSPKELGIGNDARQLSVMFKEIIIESIK